MFISLKPLAERDGLTDPARHRPPAPAARAASSGIRRVPGRRAGHPRRRAARAAAISVHASGARRSTSSTHWVPKVVDRLSAACPGSPTSRPTASRAACRPASRSTGRRPRGSACACRTSTTRSTTPSRSGRSRPSTRSATSTASILEVDPRYQRDPDRPEAHLRARPRRRAGAARQRDPTSSRTLAPLVVNHQGPFPAVTISSACAPT